MSIPPSKRLWDPLLYLVVIGLAALTLLHGSESEAVYSDALGPAAFPAFTAGLLLCLLLIRLIYARFGARAQPAEQKQTGNNDERRKVFIMLLAVIGFIALVSSSWLPFWLCIALFLTFSIGFLSSARNWRSLTSITVFAVVFGVAIAYIVQTFFYFSL